MFFIQLFKIERIRMDIQDPSGTLQYPIYPYLNAYSQAIPLSGVNQNYIPSDMIPLIEQYNNNTENSKTEEKQPMPSYKEVKEELLDKLDNKSRKEKRKMIKNKRNRMKRQMIQKEEVVVEVIVKYI